MEYQVVETNTKPLVDNNDNNKYEDSIDDEFNEDNTVNENDDENDENDEDDDNDEEDDADDEKDDNKNTEETETEPIKKKRGRKSKPKDESLEIEKVQKKRGRKPKVKEVDENEKIPKKRGRKPKEKIYSVKELPKTFFEENKNETYILHLPIKLSDTENLNEPKPNINELITYSLLDDKPDTYENLENYMLLSNNKISDNLVFDTDESVNDEENEETEDNEDNNKTYNQIIEQKNQQQSVYAEEEDETKTNKIIKKNLRNIMYEFINSNNEKTWPDSTNTYCWWCCHPFTGAPCALPELYKKEKFYVSGCFCSFNCTASYNFSKNEDTMWERYSLLNLMYKKLYNNKFVKVNMAPPREVLKIFGGYMSIEEFRENSLKNDRVYTVIKPPLVSIIPKIEENIASLNVKGTKGNQLVINENILNKTQNNLKLKRNKPITNPNSTLQSFMALKII